MIIATGAIAVALGAAFGCLWVANAPLRELPANASARDVTITYLQAARSGNCVVTLELSASPTNSWCSGPLSDFMGEPDLVSYRSVGRPEFEPASQTGDDDEECVPSTIKQTNMNGAVPGTLYWNWCWTKTAHGWRLNDQGQG